MSYYRDTIPELIKKLKSMVKECLKIVGEKIDEDLSDDKMHNVIKSKKMAAENVVWASKEIDKYQLELDTDPNEEVEVEIVWDPPWGMEMMSEVAKLELGYV